MEIPISGRHLYHFSAEEIYTIINDLPDLIVEFPIVEKIETPQPDRFLVTVYLNLKLYSGRYTLEILIMDKQPHQFLKIKGYHKSRIGKLAIDVLAAIREVESNTHELSVAGSFNIGGMMKYAGRTVLETGVSAGIYHMFEYLERKLAEAT